MIRSMTGFARVVSRQKKGEWSVEIRSLNHRYLELGLKTPPSLYGVEDRIRELCQGKIKRGKVTVNISEAESGRFEEVFLDEKVIRFYLAAIRKIQRRFQLKGEITLNHLLALPQIFSVEKKAAAPNQLWVSLRPVLEKALERLLASRIREGKGLCQELLGRLDHIEKELSLIGERVKKLPEEYYQKLRGRIQHLLGEELAQDQRVWQEAALLAEKADVTEESVRLKSHLCLFREKILKESEVGKELDFLLQEMHREVNTLGVKGQDFGVSKGVVSIKVELEKIREQVQNIE